MDVLRALFRWYLIEVGTVVFILATWLGQGFDRLLWMGLVLTGAVLLTFKYGGDKAGARVLRGALGLAAITLALFGALMAGAGVFLMVQGSFGLLAGLVLLPAGVGITIGGWTAYRMARTRLATPWSETGFGRLEKDGFSSPNGFSSLRGLKDRPNHAPPEAEPG